MCIRVHVHVCPHMWIPEKDTTCPALSFSSTLFPWDRVSLIPKLDWWPATPRNSSFCVSHSSGLTGACVAITWLFRCCWGSQLRSSCLHRMLHLSSLVFTFPTDCAISRYLWKKKNYLPYLITGWWVICAKNIWYENSRNHFFPEFSFLQYIWPALFTHKHTPFAVRTSLLPLLFP